jgi:eukaryotic-like serine/threonine-protein kinase
MAALPSPNASTPQWPGGDDTRPRPEAPLATPLPFAEGPLTVRYQPDAVLGAGGMGVVRLVTDTHLSRQVAMKVMQPEVAETMDGRARFLREACVQGRLEHPAVVPVYDVGEDPSGVPFFTMKRVRGITLERVLAGLATTDPDVAARFPQRRLLSAFVQVCLALDFAHSRGVVHRDLKPGNVMLGDFGDVHVLDWGLAQVGDDGGPARDLVEAMERATRGGSVFGTPGYLAPEQARGERVDARADVYALGAMLFEVLTLEPLHDGPPGKRFADTLTGRRRSVRDCALGRELAPELDAIIEAATRPQKEARLESARALAEAVERFLAGDQDLELRRSVAQRQVAEARTVVASLDDATEAARGQALQQLVSALALTGAGAKAHKASQEALALLRQLLTHVPATLPTEVARQREARATVARVGAHAGPANDHLGSPHPAGALDGPGQRERCCRRGGGAGGRDGPGGRLRAQERPLAPTGGGGDGRRHAGAGRLRRAVRHLHAGAAAGRDRAGDVRQSGRAL